MDDNMRDELTQASLKMAVCRCKIKDSIFHSDRGSQYTSAEFRTLIRKSNLSQSMSLARLCCYGNAKCESIWGRFKVEAIYGRYNTQIIDLS
jgi:transposase InsO family protein